jgi:hypothetical protein
MNWIRRFAQRGPAQIGLDASARTLVRALREYREQFYQNLTPAESGNAPSSQLHAQWAEVVVAGGLDTALAATLLTHIEQWPTWLDDENLPKYAAFPADYASLRLDRKGAASPSMRASFGYKGSAYSVELTELRPRAWTSDPGDLNSRVALIQNATTVLGLEIRRSPTADWHSCRVWAFTPGAWMKDLVEIAQYIEARQQRDFEALLNEQDLAGARKRLAVDDGAGAP